MLLGGGTRTLILAYNVRFKKSKKEKFLIFSKSPVERLYRVALS